MILPRKDEQLSGDLARSFITGFGLAFPRKEGCAAHPDDSICGEMSDELYVKQLRAYLTDNAVRPEDLYLSRPELLARSMDSA